MKKLINTGVAIIGVLLLTNLTYAQTGVGIGTSTPNPNAVLDIVSTSNDKGVLVPRLTTSQRMAMDGSLSTSDVGLLVYDADLNGFYYWSGNTWAAMTVVQDLQLVGNTLKITNNGTATDIDLSPFAGVNTDNQSLTLTGTSLDISGGNSVDLGPLQDGVNDADSDPTNEIQDLQLVGNTLTITNNVTPTNIDLAPFAGTNTDNQTLGLTGTNLDISGGNTIDLAVLQDGVDDADNNPSNEIQSLSKTGSTVSLSNGGGSFTDAVNDADANATNELLQNAVLSGTTLQLTDAGGTTNVALASLQDGVDDADNNPTNEIQTISKAGSLVSLSGGGGSFTDAVNDADANASNELQTISKAGSTVTLSNGGGSFTDAVNDADASSTNELLQNAVLTGTTLQLTDAGGTMNVALASLQDGVDDADNNPANEIQSISKAGSTVTLSNGGGSFNDDVNDADASATNELLQNAILSGTTLQLTDAGGTTNVALAALQDGVDDADNNPSNELQTIAKVGSLVTLSNGGGSFTDDVNDADASATNELLIGGALSGTTLRLTDAGGTTNIPLAALQDGVDDADNNPSNEIQSIAKVGSLVTLSNGGGSFTDDVNDADASASNELQTISYSNPTLTLSNGGGSVSIPSITNEAFKAFIKNTTPFVKGQYQMVFESKEYDINGTYNATSGDYTAFVDGIYNFSGQFTLSLSTGTFTEIVVVVNGAAVYRKKQFQPNSADAQTMTYEYSTDTRLAKGDVVQIFLDIQGANFSVIGGTEFTHSSGRLVIGL